MFLCKLVHFLSIDYLMIRVRSQTTTHDRPLDHTSYSIAWAFSMAACEEIVRFYFDSKVTLMQAYIGKVVSETEKANSIKKNLFIQLCLDGKRSYLFLYCVGAPSEKYRIFSIQGYSTFIIFKSSSWNACTAYAQ